MRRSCASPHQNLQRNVCIRIATVTHRNALLRPKIFAHLRCRFDEEGSMLRWAAQHAPRNGDVGRVEFGHRTSKELRARMRRLLRSILRPRQQAEQDSRHQQPDNSIPHDRCKDEQDSSCVTHMQGPVGLLLIYDARAPSSGDTH